MIGATEEDHEEDEDDDEMAKDYHVCETSEQFFEPDFSGIQIEGGDQILSDSLRIEEVKEEVGNGSQDNQNTLILDSQSIIIESGDMNSQYKGGA